MTSQSTLHNFLAVFSQKLFIVETRLSAFSGYANKVISIKTALNNLNSFDNATNNCSFKHFKPSKDASSLFRLHAYNSLYDVIMSFGAINNFLLEEIIK